MYYDMKQQSCAEYLCYDEEYFDPVDNESQSKKYSERKRRLSRIKLRDILNRRKFFNGSLAGS